MPRLLIARDGFYRSDTAWRAACVATYHRLPHVTGLRSTTVYHPKGVRERLQAALGLPITRWDEDPADENGVFYQGLARGRAREIPGVHSDFPLTDVTAVVYLTPGLPPDCGTSLRPRATLAARWGKGGSTRPFAWASIGVLEHGARARVAVSPLCQHPEDEVVPGGGFGT